MQKSDKDFYEKLNGQSLDEQGVFDARNNFVGFFELLYHIDERLKEEKNNKKNKD